MLDSTEPAKRYLIRWLSPDGHVVETEEFTGTSFEVSEYAAKQAPVGCDDWQISEKID